MEVLSDCYRVTGRLRHPRIMANLRKRKFYQSLPSSAVTFPWLISVHFADMASHAVQHIQSISPDNPDTAAFSVESILKGIHYFR